MVELVEQVPPQSIDPPVTVPVPVPDLVIETVLFDPAGSSSMML